jgi:hypothetical protein
MKRDYTQEYLQLIEEIAEDGELTNKEIVLLAKWLNENKEGRKTWPASLFLPILKDVFADGKIDKSEAHQVGKLIQKVRRQWSREQSLTNSIPSQSALDLAIRAFDDSKPRLPSIETVLPISSFNEPGMVYEVNLAGPSCSCPDFKHGRHLLPVGHISRCCKHIMQAFSEARPSNGWPSWLDSFVEAGFNPPQNQEWNIFHSKNGNYLVSSVIRDWGNVYARISGDNEKYGYNVVEKRWSYGNEPENAVALAKAIRKLSK